MLQLNQEKTSCVFELIIFAIYYQFAHCDDDCLVSCEQYVQNKDWGSSVVC